MLLPRRALSNPLGQPFDFLFRQLASGIDRRHAHRCVFGRNASHEIALLGMTGDDGSAPCAQIGSRMGFGVEAQFTFVVWGVRPVTDKTLV
jgi:hypothetical protein